MKDHKLNYRFHDPNPAAVTADYILKILIEANAGKVDSAIQQAVNTISTSDEESGCREGCSA